MFKTKRNSFRKKIRMSLIIVKRKTNHKIGWYLKIKVLNVNHWYETRHFYSKKISHPSENAALYNCRFWNWSWDWLWTRVISYDIVIVGFDELKQKIMGTSAVVPTKAIRLNSYIKNGNQLPPISKSLCLSLSNRILTLFKIALHPVCISKSIIPN